MTRLSKIIAKIPLIALIAAAVGFAVLYALTLTGFMLLGAAGSAFWALVLAAFHIRAKKKDRLPTVSNIVIVFIELFGLWMMTAFPSGMRSNELWRFRYQDWYLGLYRNVRLPEEFRHFAGDVEGRYSFGFMPSLLQGTGYCSVTFETTPERAAEYAAEYAGKAKYALPLWDYFGDREWSAAEKKYVPATDKQNALQNGYAAEYDDNGGDREDYMTESEKLAASYDLNVYVSDTMREGYSGSAQVYVLDSNLNFNHPRSTAVIVDTERNMIQLSQLG